jgi:tetratricopeptide (TPR) repeat protein
MHLAHAPPRIRDVNPTVDVPLPLEQAIVQSLEKTREHRFATATAYLQALDDAEAPGEASGPIARGDTVMAGPGPSRALLRRGAMARAGKVATALVGVALLVGGIMVIKRVGGRAAALVAAPPKPAPAPPDMADRYKKVEGWLEDGNVASARRALEQAMSERPKDGRVRYMLGRVAFADDRHQEALSHYREAISLDAGFRGDAVLLSHLDTLLGESRQADGALDLLIEKIGAPAADLLEKVANDGTDLTRRQRAAAALDDIGEGKRVDQVALSILELKKATSCEEKKVVVAKLKGLGDVRALPAIRALRGRNLGPLRFGGADTRCMKKELPRRSPRSRRRTAAGRRHRGGRAASR